MVELIYPPDPQALLPPILACLPTAFASPKPPPAFIPLLAPILRQRLHVLSVGRPENWLKLLCWDHHKAERLQEQVENATFEPHPVSGEIEVGDIISTKYKRFDHETLRCQIALADWPFTPMFLWCTGGDDGDGWKLAELLPSPGADESWSSTIEDANNSSKDRMMTEAFREADAASTSRPQAGRNLSIPGNDEDDYWAQYDRTPGRTPQRKESVQPNQSDVDYYARYGGVQPAMDNHDPDEEMQNGIETTLNGNTLHTVVTGETDQSTERDPPPYQDPDPMQDAEADEKNVEIRQPVPASPSSRGGSDAIGRLEDAAERHNASEIGIRQHIGTSMKSMYRLAKSVGIDREEFERIIQREMEALSIFDRDD